MSISIAGPEGHGRPRNVTANRAVRAATSVLVLVALAVTGLAIGRVVAHEASTHRAGQIGAAARAAAPVGAANGTPAGAAVAAVTGTASIASLEAKVAANPSDLASMQSLGTAYVQKAVQTGDPAFYDLAGKTLQRATDLAPTNQRTMVAKAVLLLSLHDFAGARTLASSVAEANPRDNNALAALVDAQVELGHYDDAATTLQQLLDLRPDAAALSRLSYVRELHGDDAGALDAMREATVAAAASAADEATITTFLGDLQLGAGSLDLADASYTKALTLVPHLVNAELGKARVLVAQGKLVDAATLLDDTTQRSPQPAAAILLGEVRALAGDERAATDAYALVRANEQLLRSAGVTLDLETARFEAEHGNAALAVAAAQAAHDTRQTIFTADALGWALTKAGRPNEALPYVDEALRLGTTDATLHLHAAVALAATGDAARAVTELQLATTRSPWTAPTLRATAVQLATSLHVDLPTTWSTR
jgi:tetratricopeptide (TPR) repeat protein